MKNKQKKTQKSYLYIIFIALAFVILLGTGAYAYYQTTITGTISGSVSKWSFKANNQTSTFNIDFGSLYPGKYAEYSLGLSAEDSDLPVMFELIFHWPESDNAGSLLDIGMSKKLFVLNAQTHWLNPANTEDPHDEWSNWDLRDIPGLKGIIMPGEKATIPLYYNWGYTGHGDLNIDIDDYAEELGGQDLTMPITIVGRQADISSAEAFLTKFYESDLLGLNSSCSNGTYSYPNRYGIPCEFTLFPDLGNDALFLGSKTIDFTFDDGTTEEFADYMIWPIKFALAE